MSDQTPITYRYYPRLSSVVSENDIPDILGFIKTGVVNLLNRIYFKDLQYSKSPKGDSAFYSLSIVSKRIDIEIPGTGIFLVLNPDMQGNDNNISAFPITIEYQWKILAYLRYFSLGNFSFDPQQIFEVALRILNITEEQAIAHFINSYVDTGNQDITPLRKFVDDINGANILNTPLTLPTNATTVQELVTEMFQKSGGKYASLLAFSAYLASGNPQDIGNKVKEFFKSFIPQDIDEFIKEVIIPKFRATLTLSAGIEFPRSILTPVYPANSPNSLEPLPGDQKVMLSFGEALFYADTEKGFGYNMDIVLNTNYPAMIGQTGFVIDIHNLKIDLSKKENIAEADADGRPKDFMGVYMEYTEIFLPKKWFKKNPGQTIGISANHLLVGTGGLSGNITIGATYQTQETTTGTTTTSTVVSYFNEYFDFSYPILVNSLNNSSTGSIGNYTSIGSYTELLTFINGLSTPSQLKLAFPLTLTLKPSGEVKNIRNEREYYDLIKNLNTNVNNLDPNTYLWFNLGKNPERSWRLGFKKFDIDFHQGQVVGSSLHAALEIKKFKKVDNSGNAETLYIDVKGEWESKENFKLSAAFLPGGWEMNLFNILNFNLQNVEIGKKNDDFYITADTKITFPKDSFGEKLLGKQGIDLPAIRYYASGKFEIAGGNTTIPINLSLNIGPVKMGVTALHMGTIQRERDGRMRKYNYIGFDGGISVNPLGLDVRGNGVKFYYTTDNDEMAAQYGGNEKDYKDSYFHIATVEVDLVIPGSASAADAIAIIKGGLTIPEPGVSTEYRGKVSVDLPKMKIYGSAEMAFDPKYPGFFIDASIEFPFVIPLGSFGIFGFRGLLGYRYVADKQAINMTANDSWYDYYMYPERGIHMPKFIGPQFSQKYSFPFSIGAGASLATLDGRLASLRAMVLLSIPTMFAIDAGLTIISERLGLAEDDPRTPPFYAFVIISSDSLEIGAGGNFQINKNNGSFVDIKAEVQMGFFFKNQRPWYINFGTREKPIRASLFKDSVNIKAEAFLMISAKGIEAGAKVNFNLNLFIVKVWAAIEVGGYISFERPQTGGYIYVEGGAEINLFIIKVSLFISIYFRVELVKPFLILAELKFELEVRLFIIKINLKVHLTLKWEKEQNTDTSPVAPITHQSDDPNIDYPKTARLEDAVKGINMLTDEEFKLKAFTVNTLPTPSQINSDVQVPIIPLDTYLDIKVEKGLAPSAFTDQKIGGHTSGANGFTDLIPPKKVQPGGHVLRQVKHQYSIESIAIKIDKNGSWQDYNPYKAVVSVETINNNTIPNIDNFKIGFWQKTDDKYDTIRLLATTPFSFLDGGQPGWFIPEQYGITASTLFCSHHVETWHESNVLNKIVGTIYYQPTQYANEFINGAYYNLLGAVTSNDYMSVSSASNPHGYAKSLKINNGNTMVIILPEAAAKVDLLLSTMARAVTIKYYRDVYSNSIYQQYELVAEVIKTKADLAAGIINYDLNNFSNKFVSKIEIEPYNADQAMIDSINAQIDQIWLNAAANTTGQATSIILSPAEQDLYNELIAQLEEIRQNGCSSSSCNELEFEILTIINDYNGLMGSGIVDFNNSEVINDWNSYEITYMQVTGSNAPFIDFNQYSVLFLYLPKPTPLNPFIAHNTFITKITDKIDHLDICFSSDHLLENRNNALIIKIAKTGSKPLSLKFTPNCGCEEVEPCRRDDFLCAYLNRISYELNTCIAAYLPASEFKPYTKCFEILIRDIYNFNNDYPYYNLYDILKELIERLEEIIGNYSDYTLNDALEVTEKMFSIIREIGDCDCNYQPNTVINCYTLLHNARWLTALDYQYQQTIPGQAAINQNNQLMIEAINNVIQPVWRPNSVYCLHIQMKDDVNDGTPHLIDYYFGFKTAGPIGHFEKRRLDYIETVKDENGNPVMIEDGPGNFVPKKKSIDEYPITSLKSYIDMKRSYPNANGDLLMSKPLFYGNSECEINLFFTKPYIYHMLKKWEGTQGLDEIDGSINIAIKDPVTDVIIPYPLPQDWSQSETVPGTSSTWQSDTDPNLPLGIQQMINYVNYVNQNPGAMHCSISLGDPIKPKAYAYNVKLTDLKPEKLYTAIIYNAFDEDQNDSFAPQMNGDKIVYSENQKIHEFVFKTSRYKNFKEQVESYKLKEYDDNNLLINEKNAVYEIYTNLTQQQIDDVYILVFGGVENSYLQSLVNTYSEVFDRAWEGVLGIQPLDPPLNTEFVKIVNNETVVAILIRNPEPFNDPKIPLAEIQECAKVLSLSGNINNDFKVLFSKDYSQILVMHKSKKIVNKSLQFRFTYKVWNGNYYEAKLPTIDTEAIYLTKN